MHARLHSPVELQMPRQSDPLLRSECVSPPREKALGSPRSFVLQAKLQSEPRTKCHPRVDNVWRRFCFLREAYQSPGGSIRCRRIEVNQTARLVPRAPATPLRSNEFCNPAWWRVQITTWLDRRLRCLGV